MALSNDLTLNPGSYGGTAGDKVYKLVFPASPTSGSLRRVAATALTAPESVTINHRVISKSDGIKVNQHQIRADETVISTLAGAQKIEAWMVIKAPEGVSEVTAAKVKDLVGRMFAAWMGGGNADAILAGES